MKSSIIYFIALTMYSISIGASANKLHVADAVYIENNTVVLQGKQESLGYWYGRASSCKEIRLKQGEYESKDEFELRKKNYAGDSCTQMKSVDDVVFTIENIQLQYDPNINEFSFWIDGPKYRGSHGANDKYETNLVFYLRGDKTRHEVDGNYVTDLAIRLDNPSRYHRSSLDMLLFNGVSIKAKSELKKARMVKAFESSLVFEVETSIRLNPSKDSYYKNEVGAIMKSISLVNKETNESLFKILMKDH